jgi:transposase
LEVWRVAPPPVQNITGRPKSAGPDGQWWPRRHTCGLLAGAFRPTDPVCVRRRSWRQRGRLRTSASPHSQPRQTALPQMHRTQQQVGSALAGLTGMALLRAILAGERDPGPLAKRRHDRCQHDDAAIATALPGQWREAPRFA